MKHFTRTIYPVALYVVTLVAFGFITPVFSAPTGPVSITIDGTMTDWATVLANPENRALDNQGICVPANTPDSSDLDAQPNPLDDTTCVDLTPSGRDLKTYAFTWDNTYLYMYVERWTSTSNATDWWFYLDTSNDGNMQTGEPIFRVNWKGNNGDTNRDLYSYTQVAGGGDPMVNPVADGYDMPGSVTLSTSYAKLVGGSTDGSAMESRVLWSALGFAGPNTVQFHISSSNGTNLPSSIIDNMDGPAAGGLNFVDLAVTKIVSSDPVYEGDTFTYTISIANSSPDTDATNVTLDDVLPAGVAYVLDVASVGSYDDVSGVWTVGTVVFGGTETLVITVLAGTGLTADTIVTNTANNLNLSEADTDPLNNSDSINVTIKPRPALLILKSSSASWDPINFFVNPKAIPGARTTYTVTSANQGYGVVDIDTMFVTDAVPANTTLYVAGAAPFPFADGAVSSVLTYNYGGLADLTDDVEFFDGTVWTYVPTAGADGCDATVQQIRINPKGTFASATGGPPPTSIPSFDVSFTVCLQ